MKKSTLLLFTLLLAAANTLLAQKVQTDTLFTDGTFAGINMRCIGPAFMSGRIADIAIHPDDDNIWYVAVGSGGVWKTTNAGTTWTPIFDKQDSYSIGCVTIDAGNPNIIWVGTGENVGGRHVGFGDGIYKSEDGGKSWQNKGLKLSEHISKIIVHPENSNIIYVAAQGPLWSAGGERGFYRTTDGGTTWNKTLGDDAYTGVTDIALDPRNPDRIYAATWQRHRTVASFMGGGDKSGIHRSDDGGLTWTKLTSGLPSTAVGKIGLAVSPQKPDVIYAAIEMQRRSGGLYRSEDRGQSWLKMSDAVAIGTGPHYYQELYASPHVFDKIYLMDVRIRVSENGGATFRRMKEESKHSDNHALAFRADDPDYLLVGTDGGLYESYDHDLTWRYFGNLPVTQFYKIALDDTKPFYNIYGGTQDNNTQGGPSRTDNKHGIRNADWFVVLYADGHQPATEPGNPDIVYANWQEGNLNRIDRSTGEVVYIRPQPAEDDPVERFNWDAPILVSPHSPTRLYFASQRVWRSDDRGDSWQPISADLTQNTDRMQLPLMERRHGYDANWDFVAMSVYSTITSLAESPVEEGLLYAGTDDGLVQVSEDGGTNWRRIVIDKLPGVPKSAFVNDIKADLFDASTVYVALDNHKAGDFKPYLYKSTDRGKSWVSIVGNLPQRTLVWRLVQDYQKKDLLFAATEFGVYFTLDGGTKWIKISGDVPTIAFRDLAIQRRENDLVAASFGRGIYILDDYSFLRSVTEDQLKAPASLFAPRKTWLYVERPVVSFDERGSQGADTYQAPNPPFGAVFTYFLPETLQSAVEERSKNEKEMSGQDISFPAWDTLDAERRESKPELIMEISDVDGQLVSQIKCEAGSGFHQVAWDLVQPFPEAADIDKNLENWLPGGMYVTPGTYTAVLTLQQNGEKKTLTEPVNFEVEKLYKGALPGVEAATAAGFAFELNEAIRALTALRPALDEAVKKTEAMQHILKNLKSYPETLFTDLNQLRQELYALDKQINGHAIRREMDVKDQPTLLDRLNDARMATGNTYGPTATQRKSLEIANSQYQQVKAQLEDIRQNRVPQLEAQLTAAGAPWMRGQPLPEWK